MIGSAVLAGGLIGAGVLAGLRATLAPPRRPLARQLTELYEPVPDGVIEVKARWQRAGLAAVRLGRPDLASLSQDLAVTGTDLGRHVGAKLATTLVGVATPLLVATAWSVAGIDVSPVVVLVAMVGVGAIGFVVPDVILARHAAARRRDFRRQLVLFLDLVVIVLAGGGGPSAAMRSAAEAGTGWGFQALAQALDTARVEGLSEWVGLRRLAESIGSDELDGLASSVELAGNAGARVRESLRAKAVAIRSHELSATEAEALAASERMGGPMVGMFVALILLLGYPAMVTVLSL